MMYSLGRKKSALDRAFIQRMGSCSNISEYSPIWRQLKKFATNCLVEYTVLEYIRTKFYEINNKII